jgi:hypothetical protein
MMTRWRSYRSMFSFGMAIFTGENWMSGSTVKTSDDAAKAADTTVEVVKDAPELCEWEPPVLTKLPALEATKNTTFRRFDAQAYS